MGKGKSLGLLWLVLFGIVAPSVAVRIGRSAHEQMELVSGDADSVIVKAAEVDVQARAWKAGGMFLRNNADFANRRSGSCKM